MKTERFKAIVLEGHKDSGVEVPFDPATRWTIPTVRLEPGRHGHRVQGRLNGVEFESVVVARGGGFFLIIPEELKTLVKLATGDEAQLVLHPRSTAGASPPSAVAGQPPRRSTRRPTSAG